MGFFLVLLYIVLFSLLLKRWNWVRKAGIKPVVLIALFILKILAGVALTFLYGTYYDPASSDIYIYFNDAVYLKKLLLNDAASFWNILVGQNLEQADMLIKTEPLKYWFAASNDFIIHEKKTLILLNLVLSFISLNHIYVHVVWMSFIAFLGQIALFRMLKKQNFAEPIVVMLIVFLLPTFTLWTSSILKESLIVFFVGFSLYYSDKFTEKYQLKHLVWAILFFAGGLFVKAFVMICLSLPLIFFIAFKRLPNLSLKKQSLTVFGVLLLLNLMFYLWSLSSFNVYQKLSDKQAAFFEIIEKSQAENNEVGSSMDVPKLEGNFGSFLENALPAFSRVLFKPGLQDIKKPLYFPDVFQNLLLLLISILIPFKLKTPEKKSIPFLWFSVLFVLVSFTLIGLVTPVLGAIVRYKIIAFPFLFFFLLSFVRLKRPLRTSLENKLLYNEI